MNKTGQTTKIRSEFYRSVAEVLRGARAKSYRAINSAMVEAYWHVGRMIVEEEQRGERRAEYGAFLLKNLSLRLTAELGRGFSEINLRNFRQFYLAFPGNGAESIRYTPCSELTWSHYRVLMRVDKPAARDYYLRETIDQNWSVLVLQRQINTLYYERQRLSRKEGPSAKEVKKQAAGLTATPKGFVKDPVVLEFIRLEGGPQLRESALERAIIGKLQAFMLELGKGFAFVSRQYRVSTETKDFFVDLVFYNYILKCFLLIDLKTGELTHQDIGQMDMYVRIFEDKVAGAGDNPTVGLILCVEKDHTLVKYSVLNESSQLFASKYRLYLPSEEELREEIERGRGLAVREEPAMYRVERRHIDGLSPLL